MFAMSPPTVPRTTLRQCHRIALAMLVMTGRVTMLGLSRWAGRGQLSDRPPFFRDGDTMGHALWVFFRHQVYRSEDVYLLVGDEVVVTKADKSTHGLDRFFASLYGKPVPGAFFTLALVSVQARRSFPCASSSRAQRRGESCQQGQAAAKKAKAPCTKRRPGRPKGSKNTPKANVPLTPELLRITGWLDACCT